MHHATRAFVALLLLIPVGGASAQTVERTGRLHVVWDGEGADSRAWFLVEDDGSALRLDVPAERADEMFALDRSRVTVSGGLVAAAPATTLRLGSIQAAGGPPTADPQTTRDFITLLCRFPDQPLPFGIGAVQLVHGPTYPGVQQFYREMSRDPSLMAGSAVAGWFDLPKPHAAYVNGTWLDFGGLTQDCIAAADPFVDFSLFYGINLQMNGPLSVRATPPYDPLSFGGGWSAIVDGAPRVFGVTWLSGLHYQNYVVVWHEIGHALGWPHSSGPYGQEYDSRWDVMSAGYFRGEEPWGALSIHTIAHHKRAAQWIPDDRRFVPTYGETESIFLARSALPPDHGYLMAEFPSGDGTVTVEARLHAGHDHPLPAQAIVVHRTDGLRAYVVDPDGNGDPNDEAAIWRVGETFVDGPGEVAMRVDSAAADGFHVTFHRGNGCLVSYASQPASGGSAHLAEGTHLGACGRNLSLRADPSNGWIFVRWAEQGATLSHDAELALVLTDTPSRYRSIVAEFTGVGALRWRVYNAATGGPALPAGEASLLDHMGNRNGSFDVGDVRAFLDAYPG